MDTDHTYRQNRRNNIFDICPISHVLDSATASRRRSSGKSASGERPLKKSKKADSCGAKLKPNRGEKFVVAGPDGEAEEDGRSNRITFSAKHLFGMWIRLAVHRSLSHTMWFGSRRLKVVPGAASFNELGRNVVFSFLVRCLNILLVGVTAAWDVTRKAVGTIGVANDRNG